VDVKPYVVGAIGGAVVVIIAQQVVQSSYKPLKRGDVRFVNYPSWTGSEGRTAEEFLADKVKEAVIRAKNDPQVRLTAIQIVKDAGLDGRQRVEVAEAVRKWVQDNITYIHDPVKTEVFQEAIYTLTVSRGGDCDDQAILVAGLLMSIGIPVKLMLLPVAVPFDPKTSHFTHIFSALDMPDGTEIWLETIVPGKGLDYRHFHTAEMRVDLTPGKPATKKVTVVPNGGTGEKTPMPGFSGLVDIIPGIV
jgi:transglutaminase-like putative cysteine protease